MNYSGKVLSDVDASNELRDFKNKYAGNLWTVVSETKNYNAKIEVLCKINTEMT